MAQNMVYSPIRKIPICKEWMTEDGVLMVEFKNNRTGKKEKMKVDDFVDILLNWKAHIIK